MGIEQRAETRHHNYGLQANEWKMMKNYRNEEIDDKTNQIMFRINDIIARPYRDSAQGSPGMSWYARGW